MNIVKKRNKAFIKIFLDEGDFVTGEKIYNNLSNILPMIQEGFEVEIKISNKDTISISIYQLFVRFIQKIKKRDSKVTLILSEPLKELFHHVQFFEFFTDIECKSETMQ